MFLAHVNPLQASIFSSLAIVSRLLTFVMLGSHWLRNYVYAFAAQSWLSRPSRRPSATSRDTMSSMSSLYSLRSSVV